MSRINDNSCDCPDGSDEPGTAACAFIDPLSPEQPLPGAITGTTNSTNSLPGFWCANDGHIGAYVPFTYVNDGVCDYDLCCDGTEEYSRVGGVKCENRCGQIGKDYRKKANDKRKKAEAAGLKRKAMVQESQDLRRRVEIRLSELHQEVKRLEVQKDELQRKHAEVEKQDRGKLVRGEGAGGKVGVLVGLAKTRVNELRNTLDNVVTQRDNLRDKVDELEGILKKFKEEYNPNFNDEGVKSAVKAFEDYAAREAGDSSSLPDSEVLEILKEDSDTTGVNWQEFEGVDGEDTDISELCQKTVLHLSHGTRLTMRSLQLSSVSSSLPSNHDQ